VQTVKPKLHHRCTYTTCYAAQLVKFIIQEDYRYLHTGWPLSRPHEIPWLFQ